MWSALQQSEWVEILATNRGLYGFVLAVHYLGLCLCVGTIVLLDLRILGIADRKQALSALAEQVRPWTRMAFAAVAVSGFLLFTTEAAEFAAANPFRAKIVLVFLAVAAALGVERSLPKLAATAPVPVTAKVLALVSILLWLGVILVSVEIPALTGLG